MTSEDDSLRTPKDLWEVLRYYIEHACVLMGLPHVLAARVWLTRSEHRFFCDALRPLEHLLRRLLLLDAFALDPASPVAQAEIKRRVRKTMTPRSGATFDPDHSETWRTHFDVSGRVAARSLAKRRVGSQPVVRVVSSAPLALRLEALIRGFNDPAPLMRRLMRVLARAPKLLKRFTCTVPRHLLARPANLAGRFIADMLWPPAVCVDTS